MSVHQLPRIEAIFHAALAQPPERRDGFLTEACGNDEELHREVAELLAHAASTYGFLERPIAAGASHAPSTPAPQQPAATSPRARATTYDSLALPKTTWNPRLSETQWIGVVSVLAVAKITLLLVAFGVGLASGALNPTLASPWISFAAVSAYGAMGAALVAGGRLDPRCREFGVFFLLVACAFADVLGLAGHSLGGLTRIGISLRLDAFLPIFFWLFARDFPVRASLGWSSRFAARAVNVSLVVGIFLAAANIAFDMRVLEPFPSAHEQLGRLSRSAPSGSLYWVALFFLMLPGTPVLLARARHVGPGDRRRVLLFVSMIVLGLVPISLDISLRAASSAWARAVADPSIKRIVNSLVLGALLTVPFTTAYAVVVARVADLRLVLRGALMYALTRYSVIAVASLPIIALGLMLYSNRLLTIQELVFSRYALWLATGAAIAAVTLRASPATLRAVDKRFFREHFDARQILADLVDGARRAESTERLADLLVSEVDRALHLDRIAILIRQHDGTFVARDEATRPLPGATMLVRLASASDDPLDVGPHDPRSVFQRLDEAEQAWLADGAFRLLVPIRGTTGKAIGMLALGEKKSELPYSSEDRRLLAAVGASGGVAIESRTLRDSQPPDSTFSLDSQLGRAAGAECLTCGRVHAPVAGATLCDCGATLVEAAVPAVLAGKFRIDRRIGAGGMGVVYRASDLTLGRAVAIKTLPAADASDTWRLRREARAMALVNHENLAMIYAVESWNGVPLLVQEYLAGGTLADRLAQGRRPVDEVVALGIVLGHLLETIHSVGLLHRDIKPSNIGFSGNGTVKLLDFGLAQIVVKLGDSSSVLPPDESGARRIAALGQATQRALGTPAYMAPEAIRNERPSVSFDLWSLAVVLVESLQGVNPFLGDTVLETLDRIGRLDAAAVTAGLPPDKPEIAEFFAGALAADKRRRPSTATELVRRLSALRS